MTARSWVPAAVRHWAEAGERCLFPLRLQILSLTLPVGPLFLILQSSNITASLHTSQGNKTQVSKVQSIVHIELLLFPEKRRIRSCLCLTQGQQQARGPVTPERDHRCKHLAQFPAHNRCSINMATICTVMSRSSPGLCHFRRLSHTFPERHLRVECGSVLQLAARFNFTFAVSVSDSLSVQQIPFLGYRFYRTLWKSGTPGGTGSVVWSLHPRRGRPSWSGGKGVP